MKSALALMLSASVAAVPHIPGSTRARLIEMQSAAIQQHAAKAGAWTDDAFYVVAVILVIAILLLIAKCVKGPSRPENLMEVVQAQAELDQQLKELAAAEKELIEAKKRAGMPVEEEEEEETEAVDYEGALRMAAQVVAQTVGPKVAKGQAVKTILETRVDTLTKQTKSFVIDELNGTAGAVLNELGAEEAMLLLDPQKALEGNFPPAAVLLAGLCSPIIMALTALNHVLQAFLHFLPIVCLCIAAVIIDQGSVCFIPYMKEWVWAHLIMGIILFLAHICQVVKVVLARSALTAEIAQRQEDIKKLTKNKAPSIEDVRNVFISICVIVQKALQSEDGVRRSFFNLIVGLGTMIWILMTIWTFVIVIGYTFVPGVIAFHESAKETAGDEYCGTWMSVLAARLCCIIGVVFLMINIMIVSQWFADGMRYKPGYVEQVLAQAKKADDQAGGIPVVQTLVKAFVLRGSSDTLEVQRACAKQDEYRISSELYAAEGELAACQSKLATVQATLTGLEEETAKMPPRGFVAMKKPEPAPVADAGPGYADQAHDAVAEAMKNGEDAVVAAEKVLKEQADKAQAAFDEAKKEAEAQLERAKEQGEEALAEAQKAADAAMLAAQEQAAKAKAAFESIDYEDLKRKAEAKKQEAIEAAKELQARTKEELTKMLELIMQKLQELKESDAVKAAMEEAQKRAEEAQAKMKEIAESEEIQAAMQGDTSKLQAKAQQVASDAQAAAQDAYDNFDSEEAKKAAMEAAEKAGKAVKEGGEKAVAAAKEGAEQAKAAAPELAEKAQAAAAEGAEKAKAAAKEGAEQAKKGAEKAKEQAEKTVKKK